MDDDEMSIDERAHVLFAESEDEMLQTLQPKKSKAPRDPVERPRAAGQRLEELAAELEEAKAERYAAVRELRGAGWSHQQVADALGISRGRAQQLAGGTSRSGRGRKRLGDE